MAHKSIVVAVTLALLLFVTAAQGKAYVVAVGISDYPGTEKDLRLSSHDAETIAWLYAQNGDAECYKLLDSKATTTNVVSAMNRVFAKAGAADIVVFFFAGHGYRGGFVTYDGTLSYAAVRKAMAKSKSRNKMIFADACFSGKIRTQKNSDSAISAAKSANVMLFLSSRSNEVSYESPSMKNGFFTTYLQKGLRGGADKNGDRIVTAKELFEYVHDGVVNLSHGKQHPVMWGKFADTMPVLVW